MTQQEARQGKRQKELDKKVGKNRKGKSKVQPKCGLQNAFFLDSLK